MIRKIFYTFWTKFASALISFLVIIITAKYLGAEGRGTISLIILGITLTQIFNDIIGGGALVYLVPRVDNFKLFISAYCWTLISSATVSFSLSVLKLVPENYAMHVFSISLVQSFFTINLSIILGKENIRFHNFLNFIQVIVLISSLLFLLLVIRKMEVLSYLISLYVSYGLVFLISISGMRRYLHLSSLNGIANVVKEIFKNGFFIQMANGVQLLNYRMSYYILDHFSAGTESGFKQVGVYSTAVAVAESVWLIRQSITMVQYSRVTNISDTGESGKLTVLLAKLGFWAVLICMIPLILIPEKFYVLLLGTDFAAIPQLVLGLSPGILALGLSAMYSHFFSGIGKNYINTLGSGIGFVCTLLFSFLLIPKFQMNGAAITASVSYMATTVFLFLYFAKETRISYSQIIPVLSDLQFFIKRLKALRR